MDILSNQKMEISEHTCILIPSKEWSFWKAQREFWLLVFGGGGGRGGGIKVQYQNIIERTLNY